MRYENEILSISLPDQVTMEIEFAEEGVQGSTVQTALKRAVLVSGYEIQVPQFVKTGDKVIINTSDGSYVGRESK